VDRIASTITSATTGDLFAVVADLATYPDWLDLVRRVDPTDPADDARPAWFVTLRAQVGPLARSKRLRMVRTTYVPDREVRFERSEIDGKRHSSWTLDAHVVEAAAGSEVTMRLRYDGSFWSGILEAILGSQIDTAIPKLRAHVEA